jgi:succinate dehydrogenase / fumarate reductase cytochrome b subunit
MASPAVSWFARYLRSSIGAKQVMAVTGLVLLGFVILHMVGHLQMFGGREMYNEYAHFLQNLVEVKWPLRAALAAAVVIHIATAVHLVAVNRAARPVPYAVYRPVAASRAGRSMAWTGLMVLVFVIFHLLHFTLGQIQPDYFHNMDAHHRWDAYSMYVHGFQNPSLYAVYLVGIALLTAHLGHGASSWLQSLGLRHPKYRTDGIGTVIAVALFVGYMVPPTAVLAGVIAL